MIEKTFTIIIKGKEIRVRVTETDPSEANASTEALGKKIFYRVENL